MATEVTIHEAKTNFSRLVREVEAGGEVIVKRGQTRVARLSAYSEPATSKQRRTLGTLKGQIRIADDFDELPEDLERAFGMID
jgi:prevent-host-death family protein